MNDQEDLMQAAMEAAARMARDAAAAAATVAVAEATALNRESLGALQATIRDSRPQKSNAKLRVFSGEKKDTMTFGTWLSHVKMTARANRWNEQQTVFEMLAAMDGRAADVTRGMEADLENYVPSNIIGDDAQRALYIQQHSFTDFLSRLRKMFIDASFEEIARRDLERRKQGKNEDLQTYHGALRALYEEAWANEEEPWRYDSTLPVPAGRSRRDGVGKGSKRLVQIFLRGIIREDLRIWVRNRISIKGIQADFEQVLIEALESLAIIEQSSDEAKSVRTYQNTYANNKVTRTQQDEPMEIGSFQVPPDRKYCIFHKTNNHATDDCRAVRKLAKEAAQKGDTDKPTTNKSKEITCYNCKKSGHIAKNCPSKDFKKKKAVGAVGPDENQGAEAEEFEPFTIEDDADWADLSNDSGNAKRGSGNSPAKN